MPAIINCDKTISQERKYFMSALQTLPVITTLEEYDAIPKDIRAEVFDGQIYLIASPSQIHQTISTGNSKLF